jgi:hypothetical protein
MNSFFEDLHKLNLGSLKNRSEFVNLVFVNKIENGLHSAEERRKIGFDIWHV